MRSTLREIIEKRTDKLPDSPLFSYWNADRSAQIKISSAQFAEQTARLGSWLLSEGFKGKKIAILGENTYAWILAFFAVTCSGNVAVLLDKSLPAETLSRMVLFNDCSAVLYTGQYRDVADEMSGETDTAFYCLDGLTELAAKDGPVSEYESVAVAPEELAVIAFTSGTSEMCKSVMLSHRNIAFDAVKSGSQFDCSGNSLLLLPLYHMFGVVGMLVSVIMDGTVFITQSLRHIVKDVAAVRPHFITAVPAMMPSLCQAFQAAGTGADARIICGGAAGAATWRQKFAELGVRIFNGYGMTECSPVIAFTTEEDDRGDSYMHVIDGCSVRIEEPDEDGIGEVLVKGDNVMQGYYKMPDGTREALRDNWLHTGDLGIMNDDGLLSVVGRKKNILVLANGENVAPEPLERMISEIKGVAECIASVCGGILQAEIYAPDADRRAIADAVNELNRSLPSGKRVMKTVFREREFEKNSLGKTIRKRQID